MTSATTTATALVHVSLDVSDLPASIEFYSKLFAAPPVKRERDYAKFEPTDVPIVLSLIPKLGVQRGPQRVSHMGVRVGDQRSLMALRERLARGGLTAREEQGVACCYAYSDKLWVADPDGNEWELYLRLGDAPKLSPDSGTCCVPAPDGSSSCC